jgi:DNA-binding GntR family transcriptional regulator
VRPITTSRYEQIADELRQAINDGTLAPGTRLPPVRELATRYGVSTRTIVEATRLLLAEDLLTSHQRGTTTVRERPTIMRMVRQMYQGHAGQGSPWRAEMAAQGRIGDWVSQSQETPAPPTVAERLRIEPGAPTIRTSYTYRADGSPVYLATSWEPLAITLGTDIVLPESGPHAGKGVRDRMALIGHRPTLGVEELELHTLTKGEAQALRLRAGMAALIIHRVYYDGELPLETADIVLPRNYRPVYEIAIG